MSTLLQINGDLKLADSALEQGRPDGNLHITVGTRKPARTQLSLDDVEELVGALQSWMETRGYSR